MSRRRSAMAAKDAGLGRRVAFAAGWMVALRWLDRIIGLASIAILARILLPEHFGIVALAMLVIGFLELFAGLSTDAELIRHKDADRAYYDAAWSINILRGLAVGALMIALIRPAVDFFHEPRLAAVMAALAAIPVIQGFENVGIVDFRKKLEFDREFRFLLTARALGTLALIALAFALRSYWALALGSILRAAFRVGLSYWFHPYRPRWTLARAREIFRFSRWMMLQNLASGIHDKLPAIVIGREWGAGALAFFNMGREIADLPNTEIRAPVRRVLFPGLAEIADRPQRLNDVLVESTGMFALLTVPIPLGIALVAEDLVPLVLGPQWLSTIALLQALGVGAAFAALGTNSQLAYMALNRAHLAAIAASVRLSLLCAVLAIVPSAFGIVGIACAVAGVGFLILVADYAFTARVLRIDFSRFVAAVWRPVTAALAMCGAVWLLRSQLEPAADAVAHTWSLAWSTLLGAVVYAGCLWALWVMGGRRDGAEQRLLALVTRYLDRRSR